MFNSYTIGIMKGGRVSNSVAAKRQALKDVQNGSIMKIDTLFKNVKVVPHPPLVANTRLLVDMTGDNIVVDTYPLATSSLSVVASQQLADTGSIISSPTLMQLYDVSCNFSASELMMRMTTYDPSATTSSPSLIAVETAAVPLREVLIQQLQDLEEDDEPVEIHLIDIGDDDRLKEVRKAKRQAHKELKSAQKKLKRLEADESRLELQMYASSIPDQLRKPTNDKRVNADKVFIVKKTPQYIQHRREDPIIKVSTVGVNYLLINVSFISINHIQSILFYVDSS